MPIKIYGKSQEEIRYSPAECLAADIKVVSGARFDKFATHTDGARGAPIHLIFLASSFFRRLKINANHIQNPKIFSYFNDCFSVFHRHDKGANNRVYLSGSPD
jgi:hypothetical protein